MKNMFCEESVLTNEASVEHYFVNRLISELDYNDDQVLIKPNIDEIQISLGSNKVWYKPDYIFKRYDGTMWIIEAKSPKEINLKNHIGQGASYCLMINGGHEKRNPTEYFVITNGLKTLLYRWDCHNAPLIELNFEDICEGNPKFQRFKKLLSQNSIKLDIEVNPISFKKKIIDPMCGSARFLLNSYTDNKDLENVNGYTDISRVHLFMEEKLEENFFEDNIFDNDVTVIEGTDGSSISIIPKKIFADVIMADFRGEKIYNQERESKLSILNKQEYDLKISTELKIILFEELCSLLKNGGILSLILNKGFLEEENSKEVRDFIYQKFNLISHLPYILIDNDPNVNLSILALEKK
ncbi:type I restriction enzyme HsdR N-terminal domain-containing protein [Priestia megaterium]|uniref:type I restriction enzyme HsdR N-terminal domain-containing protein n=1 Tax=Priestia megaterium TaxID=1404 RepID=UPI00207A10DD|nr:type I restriction enzyme HsdR N-terminal domain-containing protein [Priestia megaterium]USL45657.1 type I restriction enzyme HsdR N-terminal domain-containing protein [Priestia megaterium]